MNTLRIVLLIGAIITSGLLAGLYYSFAIAVMPALDKLDRRSAVAAMQRINVVIVNPLFMLSFLGAPVMSIAAAVVLPGNEVRSAFWWALAAAAANVVATLITIACNIPLNNALDRAGDPAAIGDPAKVWEDFFGSWVRWNWVRAIINSGAFGLLVWAAIMLARKTV